MKYPWMGEKFSVNLSEPLNLSPMWRLPYQPTVRPDTLLELQDGNLLRPELKKFLTNLSLLFHAWTAEVERERSRKRSSPDTSTKMSIPAETATTNPDGRLSDDHLKTFQNGVLRIYLQDYYSFDSSTLNANMLLHLSPAAWPSEALKVASLLKYKEQFFPTRAQMADHSGRFFNRTEARLLGQRQIKDATGVDARGSVLVASYVPSVLRRTEGDSPPPSVLPSSAGKVRAHVLVREDGSFVGNGRGGVQLNVQLASQLKDDPVPILPLEVSNLVRGAPSGGKNCAYVFLRRRLALDMGRDLFAGEEQGGLKRKVPKFIKKRREGYRDLTDAEILKLETGLREAEIEARRLTAKDRSAPSAEKTSTKMFRDLHRSFVSMTSCLHQRRPTNPYANQECTQYVPLSRYARAVAQLVRKAGLTCAALNLNLFRSSAFSDKRPYTEEELLALEAFLTENSVAAADEHDSGRSTSVAAADEHDSGRSNSVAAADEHDSGRSTVVSDVSTGGASSSSSAGSSADHIVDHTTVQFHVLRKPYGLGPRYEASINLALMQLASTAPLLISEVGTFWADALILNRLSSCGYNGLAQLPKKSDLRQEFFWEELRLRQEYDKCRPVALLEANGTSLMQPSWFCGLAVKGDYQSWGRCSCALARGRCNPEERIWKGYYH